MPKKHHSAQVFLEFTFTLIAIIMLILGATYVMQWAGVSFVERREAHDEILTLGVPDQWSGIQDGPQLQVNPSFYDVGELDVTFNLQKL